MTIINRTMPLPSSVEYVLSKLKENGYQAYVVGGAVRDFLMGKTPHDYDLTSDALPSQSVMSLKISIKSILVRNTER